MKIKSIKKIENDSKRYDIETLKNHNFFANNILVHNSSVYVEYLNGEVVFASTRGDGFYGKDITEKAKIFCPKIFSKDRTLFSQYSSIPGAICVFRAVKLMLIKLPPS